MAQLAQRPSPQQLRVLFDAKVRRGLFNPVARFLPADLAEERLQDAICQTWVMFERYALERGVILDDGILANHCRLRAVDPDRHFVPCDGSIRRTCALDWRNYRAGRVEVLRLDNIIRSEEDTSPEGDRALLGLAEAMCLAPVHKLNSALDLEAWLESLGEPDREMLAARAAGFSFEETASAVGLSFSQARDRCLKLGKELAARAGQPVEGRRKRRRVEEDAQLAP